VNQPSQRLSFAGSSGRTAPRKAQNGAKESSGRRRFDLCNFSGTRLHHGLIGQRPRQIGQSPRQRRRHHHHHQVKFQQQLHHPAAELNNKSTTSAAYFCYHFKDTLPNFYLSSMADFLCLVCWRTGDLRIPPICTVPKEHTSNLYKRIIPPIYTKE